VHATGEIGNGTRVMRDDSGEGAYSAAARHEYVDVLSRHRL
jgi:hypothetical protein